MVTKFIASKLIAAESIRTTFTYSHSIVLGGLELMS